MAEVIRKNLNLILLFLILILALFLRVWRLDSVPPELFGDELDVGYQAYSILKTGRDLQGNFLPTYFQSLAEFRTPLFLYSAVPFIAIFGLSEWGVRLTAAFWGVLGVLAIYFFTKKLLNSEIIALIAAFFLTISPWHIHYSRAGFEVTLLIFLLLSGTYFFLVGLEKPNFLILSVVLFSLSPYTYSSGALFMPLFVIFLIVIFRDKLKNVVKNKLTKLAPLIFFLILIPFSWNLFFGRAADRFQNISIALNPAIEKNVNEGRQIDNGGAFFHNKPLSFLFETSRNYVWAFSPQFLFVDGDPNGRHSVGQMGEFYWFFLPLLLVSSYVLIKKKIIDFQKKALLFSWLILAPLPASLTYFGTGHATRLFLLLPPLTILGAIGAWEILASFSKSWLKILAVIFIITVGSVNLVTYFHRYYVHYPQESWRWWTIGYKEAFAFIRQNQDQYDTIIINNTYEPALIRFLFYMQYDPFTFQKNFKGEKIEKDIIRGFDGFKLDKFYFGRLGGTAKGLGAVATVLSPKTLYLASARDDIGPDLYLGVASEKRTKILKTITNHLGEPIFYLVTGVEISEK